MNYISFEEVMKMKWITLVLRSYEDEVNYISFDEVMKWITLVLKKLWRWSELH